MKIKNVLLILMIVLILLFSLYGSSLKNSLSKKMLNNIDEYNCEYDGLCTSCIVNEQLCSCNTQVCICGKETLDNNACNLFLPS